MFVYHILTGINLGDVGIHIWTYCSSSKIEKSRQNEKNRGKIKKKKVTLGWSRSGRGPAKKKRKKRNDVNRYPGDNQRV